MQLTLLSRKGCHLCDDAADALANLRDRFDLTVTVVDIDRNDDLVAVYGLRIPVVLGPDGSALAEGVVTETALAEVLGDI